MPVQLRTRRARPSYKVFLELPEDERGPSEDEASSDSAFELAYSEDGNEKGHAEDAVHEVEDDQRLIQDDESDIVPEASKSKGKGKGKGNGPGKRKAVATERITQPTLHRPAPLQAPGLSRPSARQNYALPIPSINHRHRGKPVYVPPQRTLRLVNRPSVFSHAKTVLTRSIADPVVRERVNKATAHNVGQGPVWELMEDLSWFKECVPGDQMRPIAYDTLCLDKRWELLTPE